MGEFKETRRIVWKRMKHAQRGSLLKRKYTTFNTIWNFEYNMKMTTQFDNKNTSQYCF